MLYFLNEPISIAEVHFDFNSKYAFYDYRFQVLNNYPGEIFEKIRETYENYPMISVSYFYKLLDDIYTKLENFTVTSFYKTIEPAIEYIENKYNNHISIEYLAKLCKCSESGFFKLFKKATGVTPIAYKHNIMIQNAIDLLSNTSMSIEEISNQVGFSSANYFRKIFYQLTDKSPKEFRKK